jgi:AraC-like DNA-binding protein
VEVLSIQQLIRRERDHDLAQAQRPAFHHLFWVTSGPGTHTVDFVRHRLRVGDLLHAAPGQVQQFSLAPSFDATLLVFEPDFVARAPGRSSGPIRVAPSLRATVGNLFEAVTRHYSEFDGTNASTALLRGLLETLLLAIDQAAGGPTDRLSPLLVRFEDALEESFHRTREVSAFAAILRCSSRTLTRHCERELGCSAKELIDRRVLLEARRLLAHGRDSAAQISEQLGFAEPSQFGKFFRRLAGETPEHFRKPFRIGGR